MEDEIYIKMNKSVANFLLSFVKQTITDAEDEMNKINTEDKLHIDIWKNGLNFWNNVKNAIVNADVESHGK